MTLDYSRMGGATTQEQTTLERWQSLNTVGTISRQTMEIFA